MWIYYKDPESGDVSQVTTFIKLLKHSTKKMRQL